MIARRRRGKAPATGTQPAQLTASQLTWTAVAIAIGAGPHLLHVAPWIGALLLTSCGWRVTAAMRGWPLPRLWIRVPLTVLGFWGVMFTYHSISGVAAGSALLLVMAAMKFLETRTARDGVLLAGISYFLLFATFLREQAIWSVLWLGIASLVITAALAQTVRRPPLLPPASSLRLALRLLAQSLPLALLLFVLFPRIPGPFWALPKPEGAGLSGLSEELRPGDITQLSLSDAVAFRVRFDGKAPPEETLYWRGPVLDWFDGRSWRASVSAAPGRGMPGVPAGGETYGYQVVLEPHGQRWLLALETPVQWGDAQASLSNNLQLLSAELVSERMAYRARSRVGGNSGTQGAAPSSALNLPGTGNSRTVALAQELRAASNSQRDFLQRILNFFHSEPFYYTLSPPHLGRNAVDDFLFNTRQGFCEHYASAFAVLARAGGIPARVVVGYQGGERNPFGDYWIVRQANAHAWVEVWLDGAWHRYDPTAAVAPERITEGINRAALGAEMTAGRLWRSNLFVNRMVLSWDAFNAAWDRWVLAFGPEAQQQLLLTLGFSVPDQMQLAVLAGIATAICMGLLALALRSSSRRASDPVVLAYQDMCHRLAPLVRSRHAFEAPSDFARAVGAARPDLAVDVSAVTGLYLRLRYGTPVDSDSVQALKSMVREFRPRPAPAPAAAGRFRPGTG